MRHDPSSPRQPPYQSHPTPQARLVAHLPLLVHLVKRSPPSAARVAQAHLVEHSRLRLEIQRGEAHLGTPAQVAHLVPPLLVVVCLDSLQGSSRTRLEGVVFWGSHRIPVLAVGLTVLCLS